MRFLAELFEAAEQIGDNATDIYWYELRHTGKASFYSNTPDLTSELEHRLCVAEANGIITLKSQKTNAGLAFLSWAASKLLDAADRAVKPRRRI